MSAYSYIIQKQNKISMKTKLAKQKYFKPPEKLISKSKT